MDIWVASNLGLSWIMLLCAFVYKFYVDICLYFSWKDIWKWIWGGSENNSAFNLLMKHPTAFQSNCTVLHSNQQHQYESLPGGCQRCSCILTTTHSSSLYCHHLIVKFISSWGGFWSAFPERLVISSIFSCISSLRKCFLRCFVHFFIGWLVSLLTSCKSALYILDTSPLSDTWIGNIFSYSVDSFHSPDGVLWNIKKN